MAVSRLFPGKTGIVSLNIDKCMKKNLRNGSFVLTKLPRMLIMMKTVLILLVCSLNLQAAVYSQQKNSTFR